VRERERLTFIRHVRSETHTATECNKISDGHPCHDGMVFQRLDTFSDDISP
jgi:hypothetical protein